MERLNYTVYRNGDYFRKLAKESGMDDVLHFFDQGFEQISIEPVVTDPKLPYALTMFSCHKLRVFFVSRHMSLVDACHYATKDVILDNVINIDKELRKVGIENPLIAVAGLNPHNGDNGLFGTEEITDIGPAVEAAKERGINCVGPCPADSVFHIGKSGKYDAILSLYHDQGHIACKTLDFEKSVTLTFGLPFIRSSVDHGTAFDIAGKGIAGSISLIESTKVVAEYAAKQHERSEK